MEIARLYRDAQRSFVDLVAAFGPDDWAAPVPCCPGWTARDVLSHAAGVTLDIAEGNVEGAATDPWTAAQVERWRDVPVDELLARWDDAIDGVADLIEAIGEGRPPLDCHTHEHDLRHALDRAGNRDSELMREATTRFSASPVGRRIDVTFDDGSVVTVPGDDDPLMLTGLSPFELTRSRLGRRSSAQVRSWRWSDQLTAEELSAWFMFGPSPAPIDE